MPISETAIDNLIDYICEIANEQRIFFLWRPVSKDPNDDMVIELAVAAGCEFIITHNKKDFMNIEKFGIKAISPAEFLVMIGGLP